MDLSVVEVWPRLEVAFEEPAQEAEGTDREGNQHLMTSAIDAVYMAILATSANSRETGSPSSLGSRWSHWGAKVKPT